MTNKDLNAIRNDILNLTREYSELFVAKQKFSPGNDAIPVSGKVLDPEDFVNLVASQK